jgi:hypothetical protein
VAYRQRFTARNFLPQNVIGDPDSKWYTCHIEFRFEFATESRLDNRRLYSSNAPSAGELRKVEVATPGQQMRSIDVAEFDALLCVRLVYRIGGRFASARS